MSSSQTGSKNAMQTSSAAMGDLKLEVISIPVSDVDRAKAFYAGLGWSVDADFMVGKSFRAVQLTPPGSPCSIHLATTAVPGSARGMFLVVSDIEAARRELIARGVDASEVFHFDGEHHPVAGPEPERHSYGSYASFSDPDGNQWILQEVKTRLPGRGLSADLTTLTELLRDAERLHGEYEPKAPRHHWSEWYAGYIVARQRGRTSEEAAKDASLRIDSGREALA
jgi:catechol 2,3-dioxygenase-like lactoylglutathione lyase family enzyme